MGKSLGSLVMLRALERNAEEGSPGGLVSVDVDPTAGALADPGDPGWEFICGAGSRVLARVLEGRPVGFILSDSVPDSQETAGEFAAALRSPDLPVILMQNGAWNNVTRDLAASTGSAFAEIRERPADHWSSGRLVHLARLTTAT